MIDLAAIARHYGGTVSGGQALIPAIGHSKADRGVAVKAAPDAPDGCLVHCFNGGDPLAEKDRLRADGFLPKRKAKPDSGPWRTVATFEYDSADGEAIYRTLRREPANWSGPGKRPKDFRAERFEGGRWIAGMGDCDRIPYRLPGLRQAIDAGETVYLVEGEAKADKLAAMGFAATAVAFGSKGWRAAYARHFAGAQLVILPDNDAPGRDFARKVYGDLKATANAVAVVELPGLPEAGDILDWTGGASDLEALAANPTLPDWLGEADSTDKAGNVGAFQFMAVGDLEYRPPEYLVSLLIETSVLALIFGDPGCGKSFIAIDLALCVATGKPFHGHAVKRGAVFYIAGEGFNGLARRFAAWGKARGADIKCAPLFVSTRPAQFLNADSAKAVAEAVHRLAAQHGAPRLIVIDTLARNFGPGDENSTSEMGQFIAAIDDLKAQFPGSAVLIVHHTGHGDKQRARGAMALKGALDCEYRVAKDGATVKLMNTKMKDAEPPATLAFTLNSVDLGDGASSAVLEQTEARPTEKPLTANQRLGQETFVEAAAMGDCWADGKFTGLHRDQWRVAFYAAHTGDGMDAKRKAFTRARQDLIEMGRLTVADDVYQSTSAEISLAIGAKRQGGTGGTKRDMGGTSPGAEEGESGTDRTRVLDRVPCPAPSGVSDSGKACARCADTGCEWCDR